MQEYTSAPSNLAHPSPSVHQDLPTLPALPSLPPLPPPSSLSSTEQTSLSEGSRPKKPSLGRRSRFSSEDDLILIREVAAAKAHVAPNGEVRERFEIAASKANATQRLRNAVTWKAVQDRYKRLQDRFDKYDKMESLMSGVGGEMGEAEELLSSMREARTDFEQCRDAKRKRAMDENDRKERLGAVIRMRATQRVARGKEGDASNIVGTPEVDSEGQEESVGESGPGSGKKARRNGGFTTLEDETAAFTAALKKGDERRNAIEAQRLQLDRERFEAEKGERQRDRMERQKEREASAQLELEKFRIMMDVFAKTRGSRYGSDGTDA